MNFIERIFENLTSFSHKPLLIEVRGKNLVSVPNADFCRWVHLVRVHLRNSGVQRGDRVALLAPNSAFFVACDLAILAEGAIAVPLYSRQDPKELVSILSDCTPTLLITSDEELRNSIKRAGFVLSPVKTYADMVGLLDSDSKTDSFALADVAPQDPVTLHYTSGSTGQSKGVVLTRANVDYMLPRTAERLDRATGKKGNNDKIFHFVPFCFTGARIVLWTQLYRGNPLMISTDLQNLREEIATADPHYYLNVPLMLERVRSGVTEKVREKGGLGWQLFQRGWESFQRMQNGQGIFFESAVYALAQKLVFSKVRRAIGPSLKFLICGSAPLTAETQRWFNMLGIPVYQVYGLTETTAIVTMDEPGSEEVGCVGKPIEGCDIKLTDEGELICRGPNVFPGYWNNPEESRAVLRDGWLYTGDQAEISERGNARIIGRIKNLLVPTSGHNIAPEPLEQQLLETCRGVEHAVLVGHGQPYLAVLITGDVEDSEIEQAIAKVNETQPHYKKIGGYARLPERFTVENGFLNAYQKIRRRAIEDRFKTTIDRIYQQQSQTQQARVAS